MRILQIAVAVFLVLLFQSLSFGQYFSTTSYCPGTVGDVSTTCAWGDYDNDGDQELFVGTNNNSNCHLWQKTPAGFEDDIAPAGISFTGNVAASCWGDYNNDGLLDLFIADGNSGDLNADVLCENLGPNEGYAFQSLQLFGDCTDENVAKGAVWGDFNNDGWLDLCVVYSDYHHDDGTRGPEYIIYQNQDGAGTFIANVLMPGSQAQPPNDVLAADFDNDGDLDIFICGNPSKLYLNQLDQGQEWTFTEQTGPYNQIFTSASVSDFDNDGDIDLFATEPIGNPGPGSHLFRNDEAGVFVDITAFQFRDNLPISGNATAWADFDLDGDQDLYITTNGMDVLYQNRNGDGENRFLIRPNNLSGLGDDANSRCTEWADFNNDGKSDIFMGNNIDYDNDTYRDKLYQNQYSEAPNNKYLSIKLIGAQCWCDDPSGAKESNKSAVGASVWMRYTVGGLRNIQRSQVSGGGTGSHSQGSLPLEFGVGTANFIDSVVVYWPAGDTSIFQRVPTNQRITIVEPGYYSGHGGHQVWDCNIHGNYYFSGDLTFEECQKNDGTGLMVLAGTKVLAHKTFRLNQAPKIYIKSNPLFNDPTCFFTTHGTMTEPVQFTSQYSSSNAGDWKGIEIDSPDSVYLNWTRISYAINGLHGLINSYPGDLQIYNCYFGKNSTAGIDLYSPSTATSTNIINSRFEDCSTLGIRILKDDGFAHPFAIKGDTIVGSQIGISYAGIKNINETIVPSITDCVLNYSNPNRGYGIEANSIRSQAQYLIIPRLENDSISGFSCGILLKQVGPQCELMANRIKNNGAYGLQLLSSSPLLHSSLLDVPNIFRNNAIGISCDGYSSPTVVNAVLRDNISRAAYVDARIGSSTMPSV
jgi:hypothetical protein